MRSKSLIQRVLAFDHPERIGLDFNPPHASDLAFRPVTRHLQSPFNAWGKHEPLRSRVPGFEGDLMQDPFGVIFGRLDDYSKGEPVKGPLEDGWEALENYTLPEIIPLPAPTNDPEADKFILGQMGSPFSIMRSLRRMDQLFIDLYDAPGQVARLAERVTAYCVEQIACAARANCDGVVIYDDWGTQTALLISPRQWRQVFLPVYASLVEAAHGFGLKFFMHSCGYVLPIIAPLIAAGVDAFNFDQPELVGVARLAAEFGGKVTFWCPVDIQKVMPGGRRAEIEASAREMLAGFHRGGGFIAKDYPQWEAINVAESWAQWAREVFLREGAGGG